MKTLADMLREENDLLMMKARSAAMRGRIFTADEAREICAQREKEMKELPE